MLAWDSLKEIEELAAEHAAEDLHREKERIEPRCPKDEPERHYVLGEREIIAESHPPAATGFSPGSSASAGKRTVRA